jgi:hypothetical protein
MYAHVIAPAWARSRYLVEPTCDPHSQCEAVHYPTEGTCLQMICVRLGWTKTYFPVLIGFRSAESGAVCSIKPESHTAVLGSLVQTCRSFVR